MPQAGWATPFDVVVHTGHGFRITYASAMWGVRLTRRQQLLATPSLPSAPPAWMAIEDREEVVPIHGA